MKILFKVLLLVFIFINCIFFVSCVNAPKESGDFHSHSFIRLKKDAENHWYECSCGETNGKEKHVYFEYVCSCGLQSYSPELQFIKSGDGLSYEVLTCANTAEMVFVPTVYDSLPVTAILEGAFKNAKALKKVVIADGVKIVKESAFLGCESLEKIILPESLVEIGNSAFENCSKLKEIVLPKNLAVVGEKAFFNCTSLLKIEIDRNVNFIGEQAFVGCKSLLKFEVEVHNEYFKSVNGNLYSRDLEVLICFSNGKNQTAFTVPKGTKKISDYAFYGNENLTTLYIPKSVEEIGHKAVHIKNLQVLNYTAQILDWEKISFDGEWLLSEMQVTVYANDGQVTL